MGKSIRKLDTTEESRRRRRREEGEKRITEDSTQIPRTILQNGQPNK
jgi:hypothetical protein